MFERYALIAVGGMTGASTRWAVGWVLPTHGFPWSIFVVNVVGSAILGALLAEEWDHPKAHLGLHDFGAIGFCGGLTTMSSFAVIAVDLTEHGQISTAGVYIGVSVVTGFVAMVGTVAAVRRLRALLLPVEGQP